MKRLTRFRIFLWQFSRFKVPLIGYLKPKLITIDDQQVIIKLPLNRRSKNHLNSMYFGALAVGADLAGGLHGFYFAEKSQVKISLVFKSFQAQFIKRPEADVYFVCRQGNVVRDMIAESQQSGQRVNKPLPIQAILHYDKNPEEVANFILELSLKVVG